MIAHMQTLRMCVLFVLGTGCADDNGPRAPWDASVIIWDDAQDAASRPDAASSRDSARPSPVGILLDAVVDVAVGVNTACAARLDGSVWCWGQQLDLENRPRIDRAQRVVGVDGASSVAVGWVHACAVRSASVICWGSGGYGQLSLESVPIRRIVSAPVALALPALAIAVGTGHSCALLAGGATRCWGNVSATVEHATQLSAGGSEVCAAQDDRVVQCWGVQSTPKRWLTNMVEVSTAGGIRCGRHPDGTVACQRIAEPDKPASGISSAVQVASGVDHACARLADGSVRCWGESYGSEPVQVTLAPATDLASGGVQSCAVLQDRTVACWERGQRPQQVEVSP